MSNLWLFLGNKTDEFETKRNLICNNPKFNKNKVKKFKNY